MYSCSIITAAGSHGSTYNGAVRLGPMADRSSSNAMHAQAWDERRVWRDLSVKPRPLTEFLNPCHLVCQHK